jgi:hypothetical protein
MLSLKVFFLGEGKRGKNKWLKTKNRFPSHEHIAEHKHRLGDLLINKGLTSVDHLKQALQEQARTHKPLGTILLQHHWVEGQPLLHMLAEQHHPGKIHVAKHAILPSNVLTSFSATEYAALIKSGLLPISLTRHSLLIASSKDIDDQQQHVLKKKLHPLKVHFIKITPTQRDKLVKKYHQKNKSE